VAADVDRLTSELPGLTLEVQALSESGSTAALLETRALELEAGEKELAGLKARQAAIRDTVGALHRERADIEAGVLGDPQRHLQHPHRPVPPEETRYNVIVEVWSAISVGVLLLIVAGLVFFRLVPWWGALIVGVVGYILIESALRRRLTLLLLRLVLVLAVLGAVILVFDFRLEIVLAAVAGLAILVVADNVREVSGR
jgi:hypothetical protein